MTPPPRKRSVCMIAIAFSTTLLGCPSDHQTRDQRPEESAETGAELVEATSDSNTESSFLLLLDELWEFQMREFPTWATYEGDRRFDDRLTDESFEAIEDRLAFYEDIAARAAALEPDSLTPMSRDSREMIDISAQNWRAVRVCRSERWNVSGLDGPQVSYGMIPVSHSIDSPHDLETLTARYTATEAQIGQIIGNIRLGIDSGHTPSVPNVQRAIEQLDLMLAQPIEESPLLQLDVTTEVELDLTELRGTVESVVYPALSDYLEVLRGELLPVAREVVGLVGLPEGHACYRAMIENHLGPGYDPEELHQLGYTLLAEAHAGMVEVAQEIGLEATDAPAVMAHFRSDTSQFAADEETLMQLNRDAVDRARQAIPGAFGRLPVAEVEVREMEAHRAPDGPAAYYYSPPMDGSGPGIYYVNTHAPDTRPLYNLEALAFHEAIPGHHMQIAIAQELPEMHPWRQSMGQTAFTEGWALYSELVADELGLYSSPSTHFGMYNYQAWRASRLVVDTGLHEFGWTRQQAIDFMIENTSLSEENIANEVDRYIAWPGQALAYMIGRLEIQALRSESEAALGQAFELRAFHDVVLGSGSVPLEILRQHIENWLREQG